MSSFNGATLLITGGTGSFGNTVLKHFLETDIGQIRIFSRDLNGDDAVEVPAYIDDNVSTKVIKIIQSYAGIVNRMIWRKKD